MAPINIPRQNQTRGPGETKAAAGMKNSAHQSCQNQLNRGPKMSQVEMV